MKTLSTLYNLQQNKKAWDKIWVLRMVNKLAAITFANSNRDVRWSTAQFHWCLGSQVGQNVTKELKFQRQNEFMTFTFRTIYYAKAVEQLCNSLTYEHCKPLNYDACSCTYVHKHTFHCAWVLHSPVSLDYRDSQMLPANENTQQWVVANKLKKNPILVWHPRLFVLHGWLNYLSIEWVSGTQTARLSLDALIHTEGPRADSTPLRPRTTQAALDFFFKFDHANRKNYKDRMLWTMCYSKKYLQEPRPALQVKIGRKLYKYL